MTTIPRAFRAAALVVTLAAVVALPFAPAASASVRSAPACATSSLSAKMSGSAAGMSQPVVFITVTNTTSQSCSLNGYPTITAAWTKKARKPITVGHGPLMNAPAVKPKLIVLAPGGQAWFAIGTATAFDPPLINFTRVAVATAAGTTVAGSIKVRISLAATAPKGKPYPLGVTPWAPGTEDGL